MTEAGRRLFLNCVHYIHRFDGKAPLVRRAGEARLYILQWRAVEEGATERKPVFTGSYPQDVRQEYEGRIEELNAHYVKNYELLYWDGGYRVDVDLKSLGIPSNRQIETLDRLTGLLGDAQRGETVRRALGRYTVESFDTPQQWRRWFDENKDRIFFTDVGGRKFLIVPEGYLDAK
jgi:hypothetical protein